MEKEGESFIGTSSKAATFGGEIRATQAADKGKNHIVHGCEHLWGLTAADGGGVFAERHILSPV